jgi:hypothetical protein
MIHSWRYNQRHAIKHVMICLNCVTFACLHTNDFSMQISTNNSPLGHDHLVICCPSMMHIMTMLFNYHAFVLDTYL